MAGLPGQDYYFEVNADDLISEDKDATTLGFTPTAWLAHNQLPAESRAKIDDHHNHVPIGEVVSTGISRDLETSKVTMANAGCVIKQNNERSVEFAKAVAEGKITHVSVEYDTYKDPITGLKKATKLTWISLHKNPYNKRAVITRRQGDDGETVEVGSVPARIVLTSNPLSQGASAPPIVQSPVPGAVAPPAVQPPAPVSQSVANAPQSIPAAASAAAPPPQQQPAAAAAPPPVQNAAPPSNLPPQDSDMTDVRTHLEAARKLSHDQLIVRAAQADRMKSEYEALLKFKAEVEAEKQATAQREYETRKADFISKKDQLKAVGWDLDKKEIMDAFDGYLKAPTDPKNAFAVVALQQAKDHAERVAKESAEAQAKAREAQERELLSNKWGKDILEKISKRPATEAGVAAQTQARSVASVTPQQPRADANPTVAMQQQLMGLGASHIGGLDRDPAFQSLLGTTTHELLARAKMLASAQQDAVYQESHNGSRPAQALTHLWRQQRTDEPIKTQQGADGGAFTGTPISGVKPDASKVVLGDIAQDLEYTGRYKDLCVASLLKCKGDTYVHPVTGQEFPLQELLSCGNTEAPPMPFAPLAIAQNILAAGCGYEIPWDNRPKVEDYYRPKAPRR